MIGFIIWLPKEIGTLLGYQLASRWAVQLAGFDNYGETS